MYEIPPEYTVVERSPTVEEFRSLRAATGMNTRSREGVERGLPNTLFGVVIEHDSSDEAVGMGRIVGDGGTVLHICDMAVHPDHQGRGLGGAVMTAINDYIAEHAPPETYVNLLASVDGFYEQFGYEEGSPGVKAMVAWTPFRTDEGAGEPASEDD